MPTINSHNTILNFDAGSSQTDFSFNFFAPREQDISVYVRPKSAYPDPSHQKKTLNNDYTVQLPNYPDEGGTVKFNNAPGTGNIVTIALDPQRELLADFSNKQTFDGVSLDKALFRLLMLAQFNNDLSDERNLSYFVNQDFPAGQSVQDNTKLPVLQNNQTWVKKQGKIEARTLTPEDSTLKADLAENTPWTGTPNGAHLVGFGFEKDGKNAWTVNQFLNNVLKASTNNLEGADLIGFSSSNLSGTSVRDFLNNLQQNSGASAVGTVNYASVAAFISKLESNNGAGVIGTSSGSTVQSVFNTHENQINTNKSDISTLKSSQGAGLVGTSGVNSYTNVQDAINDLVSQINKISSGGQLAQYTLSASQTISSLNNYINIAFDTAQLTYGGAPAPNSNNAFVVPTSGLYRLVANINVNKQGADSGAFFGIRAFNSATSTIIKVSSVEDSRTVAGSSNYEYDFNLISNVLVNLTKGDSINWQITMSYTTSGSSSIRSTSTMANFELIRGT